jgi:hypothetical protein
MFHVSEELRHFCEPGDLLHLSADVSKDFIQFVTVLRIRDVYPGSEFFHPGSRVKKASDPGYATATKNLSIFNPNNCHQALGNMIRDVYCGSSDQGFSPIPDLGIKEHRIPDLQH